MLPSESDALFSRDEVLRPRTRRGSDAMLLIESRTATLVAQSKHLAEQFTAPAALTNEASFFEELARVRNLHERPTIYELERYAEHWRDLVPTTPQARARFAHRLGATHQVTAGTIPTIRRVVGLDDPDVQQAYQQNYGEPLSTIYAPRMGVVAALRQTWSRVGTFLDHLPPFWMAYVMTLTETLGIGLLALPIAVATVGLLPGLVLLIVFGLVSTFTIGCMSEAITRNGNIRHGQGFLGQVVQDFLGGIGSSLISVVVFVLTFLALIAYYIGFSTTLQATSGVPALFWGVLLFGVGLYYVRQRTLNTTMATALVIGGINILLIFIIAALSLPAFDPSYAFFFDLPGIGTLNQDTGNSALKAIYGVVVAAYFGHMSVAVSARSVLKQDTGGRSLLQGTMAAQLTVIVVYVIWLVAVNGAVAPAVLAGETGTALIPLEDVVGPLVAVPGVLFTLLALGMASIHFSLALTNTLLERLPARHPPTLTLARKQGRIVLNRRWWGISDLRSITYQGQSGGKPAVLLECTHGPYTHLREVVLADTWHSHQLREMAGDMPCAIDPLTLTPLHASDQHLTLEIDTPLQVSYEGTSVYDGLSLVAMASMEFDGDVEKEKQRLLLLWLLRRQSATLEEIATYAGWSHDEARSVMAKMEEQQQVSSTVSGDGTMQYRVTLRSRRGRQLDRRIWQALDPTLDDTDREEQPAPPPPRKHGLSERNRSLLALLPMVVAFLTAQVLLITDTSSFSGLIGVIGILAVSLLSGMFPVLMLLASRRRGDVPVESRYWWLSHPLVIGFVYVLWFLTVLQYGVFLWEGPLQRAGALLVSGVMVALPFWLVRRGVFRPRSVLVLYDDDQQGTGFYALCGEKPVPVQVAVRYCDGREEEHEGASGSLASLATVQRMTFRLPSTDGQSLKLWLYQTRSKDGEELFETLPVSVSLERVSERLHFEALPVNGQMVVPLEGQAVTVDVRMKNGNDGKDD